MSQKTFGQNDPIIADYAEKVFKPEDAVLLRVRESAKTNGLPDIHVGAMDGLHLQVLTKAFNAKKVVEIGTLAGYSGIRIARSLPEDGKLYTFEFTPKHAALAKENFKMAEVDKKVEIYVGAALDNLSKIENLGPFDFVFIDADKSNYSNYFDWAAKNLRVGGAILADNTFAWGMIAQEKFDSPQDEKQVHALDSFNQRLASDPRFTSTILPTGEGLTLGVKIKS
jgi:caffeoyl-CoA O-methyltransferase